MTWIELMRLGRASDGEGGRLCIVAGARGAGEMSMSLGELILGARAGERALSVVPIAAPRVLVGGGEMRTGRSCCFEGSVDASWKKEEEWC